MSVDEFISASQAKAASSDSAMLAQAGQRAQLAMQWGLAANYFDQAAEALYLDPHTGAETIQARAHRRSAQICRALASEFDVVCELVLGRANIFRGKEIWEEMRCNIIGI